MIKGLLITTIEIVQKLICCVIVVEQGESIVDGIGIK